MLNQQSVSAGRLRVCEPPAVFKVWQVLRGIIDSLLIFLLLGNGKGAVNPSVASIEVIVIGSSSLLKQNP